MSVWKPSLSLVLWTCQKRRNFLQKRRELIRVPAHVMEPFPSEGQIPPWCFSPASVSLRLLLGAVTVSDPTLKFFSVVPGRSVVQAEGPGCGLALFGCCCLCSSVSPGQYFLDLCWERATVAPAFTGFYRSWNELVILLVFFCWCLLTGDWNIYCMVTLLEDAMVFLTSIFYQYFITLLIFYITPCARPLCVLVASFQSCAARPYCTCARLRVLFSFFLSPRSACCLDLVLGYTVVIL